MNIQRVVSDLVSTSRIPTLQNKSLRVVEDDSGDLEVALDPVGAKPGDCHYHRHPGRPALPPGIRGSPPT